MTTNKLEANGLLGVLLLTLVIAFGAMSLSAAFSDNQELTTN